MTDWKTELQKILACPASRAVEAPLSSAGIVLYGAGKMGGMALDLMRAAGKKPDYIVDRAATGELDGVKILPPELIPEKDRREKTFVVCVVTAPLGPIADFLRALGCSDVRHFYDYSEAVFPGIMPNGWALAEPAPVDLAGIARVLGRLEHDERSVGDYLRLLWWRLRRVDLVFPDQPVLYAAKYFKAPHFPALLADEVYVDGGAHVGLTINYFLEAAGGKYARIHAFEPDEANLEALRAGLPAGDGRITVHSLALYDGGGQVRFRNGLGYASRTEEGGTLTVTAAALDTLPEIRPSVIKLHLEGDELRALQGARRTIESCRPILMVLADHGPDGLYRIPDFLAGLESYKLYFGQHDHCGNTSIFYAYPLERLKK